MNNMKNPDERFIYLLDNISELNEKEINEFIEACSHYTSYVIFVKLDDGQMSLCNYELDLSDKVQLSEPVILTDFYIEPSPEVLAELKSQEGCEVIEIDLIKFYFGLLSKLSNKVWINVKYTNELGKPDFTTIPPDAFKTMELLLKQTAGFQSSKQEQAAFWSLAPLSKIRSKIYDKCLQNSDIHRAWMIATSINLVIVIDGDLRLKHDDQLRSDIVALIKDNTTLPIEALCLFLFESNEIIGLLKEDVLETYSPFYQHDQNHHFLWRWFRNFQKVLVLKIEEPKAPIHSC